LVILGKFECMVVHKYGLAFVHKFFLFISILLCSFKALHEFLSKKVLVFHNFLDEFLILGFKDAPRLS
jgi:hypothetical protein